MTQNFKNINILKMGIVFIIMLFSFTLYGCDSISEFYFCINYDADAGQISIEKEFEDIEEYVDGEVFKITAIANEGYIFDGFYAYDDDGKYTNLTFETSYETAAYNGIEIYVEFTLTNVKTTIGTSNTALGNVELDSNGVDAVGSGFYPYGTELTLTATPSDGCVLLYWEVNLTDIFSYDTEITINPSSNQYYEAVFAREYILDISNETTNSDNVVGEVQSINYQTNEITNVFGDYDIASITATAFESGKFIGWYDSDDNLVSESSTYRFELGEDSNLVYIAKFLEVATISLTSDENASIVFVDGNEDNNQFAINQNVSFSFNLNSSYEIVELSIKNDNSEDVFANYEDGIYSIYFVENINIVLEIQIKTITFVITSSNSDISVLVDCDDDYTYEIMRTANETNIILTADYGTNITFTAVEDNDVFYDFAYWTKKEGSTTVISTQNLTYSNIFKIDTIFTPVFYTNATTAIDRIFAALANQCNFAGDTYSSNVLNLDAVIEISSENSENDSDRKISYSARISADIDPTFSGDTQFLLEVYKTIITYDDEENEIVENNVIVSIMYDEVNLTEAEFGIYIDKEMFGLTDNVFDEIYNILFSDEIYYVTDENGNILVDDEYYTLLEQGIDVDIVDYYITSSEAQDNEWLLDTIYTFANIFEGKSINIPTIGSILTLVDNIGLNISDITDFFDKGFVFPEFEDSQTLNSFLSAVSDDQSTIDMVVLILSLITSADSMFYYLEGVENNKEYVEINFDIDGLLSGVSEIMTQLGSALTDMLGIDGIDSIINIISCLSSDIPNTTLGVRTYFTEDEGYELISAVDLYINFDDDYNIQFDIEGFEVDLNIPQSYNKLSIKDIYINMGDIGREFVQTTFNNFNGYYGENIRLLNASVSGSIFVENGKNSIEDSLVDETEIEYNDVTYIVDISLDVNIWALLPAITTNGIEVDKIAWGELGFVSIRIYDSSTGLDFINILFDTDNYGDRAMVVLNTNYLEFGMLEKSTIGGYLPTYNILTAKADMATSYGIQDILELFFESSVTDFSDMEDNQSESTLSNLFSDFDISMLLGIDIESEVIDAVSSLMGYVNQYSNYINMITELLSGTTGITSLLSTIMTEFVTIEPPVENEDGTIDATAQLIYDLLNKDLAFNEDGSITLSFDSLKSMLTFDVNVYENVYDGFFMNVDVNISSINLLQILFGDANEIIINIGDLELLSVTEDYKESMFEIMNSYDIDPLVSLSVSNYTKTSEYKKDDDESEFDYLLEYIFGGNNIISTTAGDMKIYDMIVTEVDEYNRPTKVEVYYTQYMEDISILDMLGLISFDNLGNGSINVGDSILEVMAVINGLTSLLSGDDLVNFEETISILDIIPIGLWSTEITINYDL